MTCFTDLKLILLLLIFITYYGGFMKVCYISPKVEGLAFIVKIHCLQGNVEVDKDIPWGPEYEHNVEFEFTPMDPRDYPGKGRVH